ncbi:oxidoreductase [soil metagenome]
MSFTRTVMITGASSGIGMATAKLFADREWNVIATMRSPEKQTAPLPPNMVLECLDVLDKRKISAAVDAGLARFGKIDVLVNNAGYGLVGPFEASTSEQIERQFATNVFGLMNVTRELLPHFREQKSGTIINVASMGGRITFPLYSLYHATKWAVEGFTESLQFELESFGIKVKIIEPGPIRTDFYERSMDVITKEGLTEYDDYVARTMPAMQKAGANAPGPDLVARVIFAAANDGNNKLRYQANSAGILMARRLLPEQMFYKVVRAAVK